MAAEGFREVGILVFVFAILDRIVSNSLTLWWTLTAVSISLLFFAGGCYLERKRSDE